MIFSLFFLVMFWSIQTVTATFGTSASGSRLCFTCNRSGRRWRDDPVNVSHPPSNWSLLDACKHVEPPVGLDSPTHPLTLSNLLKKVLLSFRLTLLLLQCSPQVAHVCCSAQLWDPGQQHEGEEGDEQPGVCTQGQVRFGTGVLKKKRMTTPY